MRILQCSFILLVASCAHKGLIPATPYSGSGNLRSSYEAKGANGVAVATQGRYATNAAFEILRRGGNIVDAAVAVSMVQAVERPHSTGLGGGGFILWGKKTAVGSKVEAWDFRERAPLAAHSEMFVDLKSGKAVPELSRYGRLASGVPGMVAGLYEFHRSYGKLPWKELFVPAIRLAREGFAINPELASALEGKSDVLGRNAAARAIFFHPKEGRLLKEGDLLIQSDLANTLKAIADGGKDTFYRGSIAKKILEEARLSRLLITRSDLNRYEVKLRPVLQSEFRGRTIYSMPPPSSGGVHLLQILNTVERAPLEKWGILDSRSVHLVSSAMQQAFADRAQFLGDPDFVKVPVAELISKGYAHSVQDKIPADRARAASEVMAAPFRAPVESDDTIHFSIMDSEGNAISSTQTINGHFGSGIVVRGTGILLNNEMDDFAASLSGANLFGAVASSRANFVEPGKTPLSSMSPTLVENGGQFVMSLGSPSGTRILTCVTQVLLNRLVYGLSPSESVAQIRYHQQWQPDQIQVDEPGFSPELTSRLEKMGHKVNTSNLGCRVQLVERDTESSSLTAVSDIRAEGSARVER
jgi:gamma-glutamyltranspeptidase / glutathione hydrolase